MHVRSTLHQAASPRHTLSPNLLTCICLKLIMPASCTAFTAHCARGVSMISPLDPVHWR